MAKPRRPKDTNQLAKLVVELSTGETEERDPDEGKNPAAVALGRLGGLKGGKARAEQLGQKGLSELGKKGAQARAQKREATKQPGASNAAHAPQQKRRTKKRRAVIQAPED